MKWLKENYEQKPEALFINEWTFKEVFEKVTHLAGKLYSVVKDTNRVALLAENSPEMAIFICALLLLKKEVFMLNVYLTEKEIIQQTEKLGIQTIFSSKKTYISFEEIDQLPKKKIDYAWEMNREQIAVIMNTSATTGKFKSVPIRWKQIEAHVKASAKVLGMREEDHWLLVLPLFHISGLSILFRSLYNGTRVSIFKKFKEDVVLKLILQGKINMISLVPTLLKRIVTKIQSHQLRVVLLGGEFIPQPLIYECQEKKLPIYKTYGMTETTSQSTTFCILEFPEKVDSVGKPLPGVKIRIKDQNKNGVGEIWIKSPMLLDGYMGMEPISDYFNTEDMGYIDKDGFLYILNRRKDIIICGGENIYPKEIEDLLYKYPGVEECAVVGQTNEEWGQIPVLYLVATLSKEHVQKYMEDNIAKYKIPKKIFYRKELPKNACGKIVRKRLQEEL